MGAFLLYLVESGRNGGDLSHNPYVSGNFEVFAPPGVSNVTYAGILGRLGRS